LIAGAITSKIILDGFVPCGSKHSFPPRRNRETPMNASRAGSLSLVGGVLALDFVNTAGGRGTPHPIEHLQAPHHLVAWATHAGAIRAEQEIGADDGLLREALRLREAIYRIGTAIAQGASPATPDLDALKTTAQASLDAAALTRRADDGYGFDFSRAPAASALLGPVAWSAIDLLATGEFARLKQCPGHDCGWLFYDRSKNNSRRWCDMAVCGNRSKAKRHREREQK
jgi:predicted RNA-binding Zn ribbon-like protein